MKPELPPAPFSAPFRTTVHGTVFGERAAHLERLQPGSPLLLIPDPPLTEEPQVWVHLPTSDPVGHLPPEIGLQLAPWLLRGGQATALAVHVGGPDEPSWRRLVIEVTCR